jgi:hypothetical protein
MIFQIILHLIVIYDYILCRCIMIADLHEVTLQNARHNHDHGHTEFYQEISHMLETL